MRVFALDITCVTVYVFVYFVHFVLFLFEIVLCTGVINVLVISWRFRARSSFDVSV